jgi:hypothetical protein
VRASAREPLQRADADEDARGRQECGLGERRQVLGFPVPVLVRLVGRANRDADGKEGQQRGDEVGSRVDRLGDEAERVRGEADRELQRDQRDGGDDGDERRTPLRAQISSSGQIRMSCDSA